jgi:hypothetical protein
MTTKSLLNNPKFKLVLISALGAILLLVVIYLVIFGRALSQSENHVGIALAIPRVILSSEAVLIDDKNYLVKDPSSFVKAMEQQGFIYVEQMGSGYFFRKDGNNYISTSRMYSSHFMVFTIPSIQIANFEQCVRAGYPVGESYPRQCWTLDQKHFFEEIKQNLPEDSDKITILGQISCLPKIGSGPQTLECAIGLKATDGKYYELKNLYKLDPQYKFSQDGLQVNVSGILSHEKISGKKYDVAGVIDVLSIRKAGN